MIKHKRLSLIKFIWYNHSQLTAITISMSMIVSLF